MKLLSINDLLSNDLLPEAHQDAVKQQLSHYRQALSTVTLEIAELERRLHEKRVLEAELKLSIEACKTAIAPHKILPPELLRKIFLQVWQGRTLTLKENPLVLSHVSSRWRSIARDTVELWEGDLEYVMKPWRNQQNLGYLEFAGEVLNLSERSGRLRSLTVTFCIRRSCDAILSNAFLSFLRAHSHRFHSVGVVTDGVHFDILKSLAEVPFPNLERLSLADENTEVPVLSKRLTSVCHPSSPLKHLEIGGISLDDVPLEHPWSRLTHLCLLNGPHQRPMNILAVLAECHNLVHCHIDFSDVTPPDTLPVALPGLRTLILIQYGSIAFLDYIIAPKLLELDCEFRFGNVLQSSLEAFLARSMCSLEKLVLPSSCDLETIHDTIPRITHLDISRTMRTCDLTPLRHLCMQGLFPDCRILTISAMPSIVKPALRMLHFHLENARQSGVPRPLRSLRIVYANTRFSHNLDKHLDQIRNIGVEVQLICE